MAPNRRLGGLLAITAICLGVAAGPAIGAPNPGHGGIDGPAGVVMAAEGPMAQAPRVPARSDPDEDVGRILDRPEHRGIGRRSVGDWLGELADWFFGQTTQGFEQSGGRSPAGWAGLVLLAGLLVAMAWGVARLGRRTARDRRVARARAPGPLGPDALEARAERAAEQGDFDAAVHLAFRALAIRHGIVIDEPDMPGRTAGEVRAATSGEHAAVVLPAVEAFEVVAYGGRAAVADDVARLQAANAALRAQVGRRREVPA